MNRSTTFALSAALLGPLAKITTFGMAPTTSDAICTQKSGAKPGKAAQKDAPPACNALLKAAGRC